jgi:hypothetical protein
VPRPCAVCESFDEPFAVEPCGVEWRSAVAIERGLFGSIKRRVQVAIERGLFGSIKRRVQVAIERGLFGSVERHFQFTIKLGLFASVFEPRVVIERGFLLFEQAFILE